MLKIIFIKIISKVPNLRFKKFTTEWKIVKFANIATAKARIGWQGLRQEEFEETGDYYLITGTDFYNNEILFNKCKYISKNRFEQDINIQLKNEDILITKDGSIGKVAYIYSLNKPATLNAGIYVVRPKNKLITSKYLFHYLKAPFLLDYSSKASTGGTIKHLNQSVLEKFKIPYSSVDEQNEIVFFLDLIDKRISTQNKIIKDLKSQMNWFIDNIIDFSSQQLKFKDLYTVAGEGGTPSTSNNQFYENGNIPFIKIEDLSYKYLKSNKDFITEQGLKNSSAWMIPANSIIFSNGATIGRISINMYPVSTKQGILGIIPSKVVLTEYLYYFMKSKYFRKQVHRITVKGTMDCAYLKDLNSIICYIPCLDKQKDITKMFKLLDEKITIEQTILNKLKEQKKFLLSNMFI